MHAVAMKDVTVRFGNVTALENISFETAPGAFVAILGPNGCGKTTLLKTIIGLIRPDSGTVTVFGKSPGELSGMEIGYVPQTKHLDRSFPAQAIEVVATGILGRWPVRLAGSLRQQALEALHATGVAHLAERQVSALSGGELQRVYLARSFVRSPRLLLLDEPAAGMDIAGEAAMYHLIEGYLKGHQATVFMITHDWEGARLHASHVLLLNRSLMDFAPPHEIELEERLLHMFGHRGHAVHTHGAPPHA
jgi:zinc transport system ATP-binding protein